MKATEYCSEPNHINRILLSYPGYSFTTPINQREATGPLKFGRSR
ncbi:hypothetical protein CGRA01v4_10712 [Colletotrichum graminicola]|nr:hypothetical protein CGRA01v4_10712 [Colletotrichum graminicola]